LLLFVFSYRRTRFRYLLSCMCRVLAALFDMKIFPPGTCVQDMRMCGYPMVIPLRKKYAVLYMQDGQMLFDRSITWNKQEWGVDETLSGLMQQGKIGDCIMVGIWNGGERRYAEYFPQKPFEALSKVEQDQVYNKYRSGGQSIFFGLAISSDGYLKFLRCAIPENSNQCLFIRVTRLCTIYFSYHYYALVFYLKFLY